MSALAYPYPETYKLPAGLLALAVHAVFFAFLYLGVSWHSEPPLGMEVEIWSSLPALQVVPVAAPPPVVKEELPKPVEPPKPVVQPKLIEPPKPVAPQKPDIALPKPALLPKPVELPKLDIALPKPAAMQNPIEPPTPQEPAPAQVEQKAQAAQADATRAAQAELAAQAESNRARAAQEAETGKVVSDFKDRIRNKIKRNIVMPPNVPDSAQAEFDVTLLPDGSVLRVTRVKASGSEEYDNAVERAILKTKNLPLPPEAALSNRFRELHLTFRPKE